MARRVELLEAAALDADDRLLVSAFQGIVNRAAKESSTAALLFIDYGTYDDPSSRRTNSVMMTEEDWLTRFRPFLERNDLDNLDWHRGRHGLEVEKLAGIDEAVARHRDLLSGFVVTDPALPDSINAALVLAGLEGLLVVAPGRESWARELGFERRHDLRGRFRNRVGLYLWAFRELRPRCAEASATCYEPAWGHPESVDLIVKERLFAFGLSSFERGSLRDLGKSLLLFLAAGSWGLRNCVFSLRLDGPLRALALRLLSIGAAETRLFQKVLRSLTRGGGGPYPTLYGWHVDRDDELSFMLLVSACGVRLAPTFMASNFSFHSCLPAKTKLSQAHVDASTVKLERDKVYLTFTLSDGDQCALMNTAQLGGFRRTGRGTVPFNWEIQSLLAELAPALLEYYYESLTPCDLLVAGPSGAGYVMPPLVPDLPAYFRESARVCALCDIRIATSYNGDPPGRVLRDHARADGFLGFVAGYFHLGRKPAYLIGDRTFVANSWPPVDRIGATREEILSGIRDLVEAEGPLPRFIGVHLFAYRINIDDIAGFVQSLDARRIKVVRADEFLVAARLAMTGTAAVAAPATAAPVIAAAGVSGTDPSAGPRQRKD